VKLCAPEEKNFTTEFTEGAEKNSTEMKPGLATPLSDLQETDRLRETRRISILQRALQDAGPG
jgi:hypothetical protein